MDVKNKKIVVLGAARSGLAAARLLSNHNAHLFVSDIAPDKDKMEEKKFLEGLGVPYEFGTHSEKTMEADFVVLSPGIPRTSQVLSRIEAKKIPVYSELEVASWFCRAPMIAVTGSNGKTTTTTLLGEILRRKFPETIVAGNIGEPFSEKVAASSERSWAVLEVSSFQLETIRSFHPTIVVLLNLAPNHLDWYSSFEAYVDAKLNILINLTAEDLLIYNGDDALLEKRTEIKKGKKWRFTMQDVNAEAYLKNEALFIQKKQIIKCDEISLRGSHNYLNAMAAGLAAIAAGAESSDIRDILSFFKGVAHRLEPVANIKGVQFINDSKATTVESLMAALNSFDQPLILIAGGKDKGSDFTMLRSLVKQKVALGILIGSSRDKIADSWHDLIPLHFADSLAEAVNIAQNNAKPGQCVLLSPACASFDMFQNFEDRGNQFKKIVNQLRRRDEN